MADTLTNIEADARFLSSNNSLDITTEGSIGLRNATMVHRGMTTPDWRMFGQKIGRRYPEYTIEDTSIKVTSGTENYPWLESPVFIEEPFIELLDVSSSNLPYPIEPVPSMQIWSDLDDSNNGPPKYYRRFYKGGEVVLALRPKPDTTSDIIRISGIVEADEFADGDSKTRFLNANADHALALFIAAFYQQHFGKTDDAIALIAQGVGLLPRYDYTPSIRPNGFIQTYPVLGV